MRKMIKLGLLGLFLCSFNAQAQAPAGFYNSTAGLSGYKLKSKLNQLTSAKTISWNYGDLPELYKLTDRDTYYENDSSVLDIYGENPNGPDPFNYSYDSSSLIAGASLEGEGWNREHLYSQSFFNSYYPMYSDLNFILPADARVNQRRSNYPYGKVGTPTFTSMNGTKVGPANIPGYTYTVTEPIDEFKGDVARMMLYVAVRYENLLPYFQYANVRNPMDSLSEKGLKNWYIPMMLLWNQQDPVSQRERDRNNSVYTLQGNRNPFVDHPEFVDSIWGHHYTDSALPEQPYQVNITQIGARFAVVSWPFVQDQNVLGFEVYLNDTIKLGTTQETSFIVDHLTPNSSFKIGVRSYSYLYQKSAFVYSVTFNTLASDTFSSDLFISKFIEGTGFNKAIELTNRTGHSIDLRDYYLNMRQENLGVSTLYWSSNKIQLEGTLYAGKKLVVMNPKAQLACISTDSADILSNGTAMQFDGKLAFELGYKTRTLDRLGISDSIMDYAQDRSLYRKTGVTEPAYYFDSLQWDSFPLDYCEGLGVSPTDTSTGIGSIRNGDKKQYHLFPNPNQTGCFEIEGKDVSSIKTLIVFSTLGNLLLKIEHPFVGKNNFEVPKGYNGLLLILIDGQVYPVIVSD